MASEVSFHEFLPSDYFEVAKMDSVFAREAPLELDLGCGDGGFLMDMATKFPERNFLGVERLLGRVRKVCKKSARRNLDNVRMLRLDSSYAIGWLLPKATFSRIHLLFPDPWPKKKHQKRRIVQPAFLASVRDLLEPGGEFLFKTDHEEYFEEASETIKRSGIMERVEWKPDSFFYAETDFERQWKAEGKLIQGVRLVKE